MISPDISSCEDAGKGREVQVDLFWIITEMYGTDGDHPVHHIPAGELWMEEQGSRKCTRKYSLICCEK